MLDNIESMRVSIEKDSKLMKIVMVFIHSRGQMINYSVIL